MKRQIIAATFAVCAAVPAAAAPLSDVFTSYFAFGDSLTDDGKFGALNPPSFEGRFTNGLTYSEMLAQGFTVYENYALGGATAGANQNTYGGSSYLLQFENLEKQIDQFEADPSRAAAGTDPLVSILMGSNDIFQNAGDSSYDVTATVDLVIAGIQRIAALGPFDDFIVPLTPGADSAVFGALRTQYNTYFLDQVAGLTAAGLNIYIPSLDAASDRIDQDPAAYGITEAGQCSASLTTFDPNSCAITGYDNNGMPIIDLSLANSYSLVDTVHPSTPVHAEWAAEISATVEAQLSPVPLPATGLLLIAGLGALGFRARRG